MKMKLGVVTMSVLLLNPVFAAAETLKGGYGACVSEELFNQLTQTIVRKDEKGMEYLLKNGCVITKAGISVSILDTTWTGMTKVRAYVGDKALILWTNTENIQR